MSLAQSSCAGAACSRENRSNGMRLKGKSMSRILYKL